MNSLQQFTISSRVSLATREEIGLNCLPYIFDFFIHRIDEAETNYNLKFQLDFNLKKKIGLNLLLHIVSSVIIYYIHTLIDNQQ